ncbi:uncharacterized protein LOC131631117 [Vicia villosa]|uniref:uncharacterized protein LOC131631117 n=1 Tax=Vicia villosa TaxID=3911 RepID=UPI00273B9E31|nr:uncharacterized protein LOC131631117 [Vicia villosa]
MIAEMSFSGQQMKKKDFVKNYAIAIRGRGSGVVLQDTILRKLGLIWRLKVLSKVSIFAWRLILGRLLTRENLKNRGILVEDRDCCCVFCFKALESSNHLFESCPFTTRIWNKVGDWLGNSVKITIEELKNFGEHLEKIKALEEQLTVGVIWLAIVWNLWLSRNAILFKGNIFNFNNDCYSVIVLVSWKWFRTVNASSMTCNFHYWNTFPLSYIKR